jgi:hypothetical protein
MNTLTKYCRAYLTPLKDNEYVFDLKGLYRGSSRSRARFSYYKYSYSWGRKSGSWSSHCRTEKGFKLCYSISHAKSF